MMTHHGSDWSQRHQRCDTHSKLGSEVIRLALGEGQALTQVSSFLMHLNHLLLQLMIALLQFLQTLLAPLVHPRFQILNELLQLQDVSLWLALIVGQSLEVKGWKVNDLIISSRDWILTWLVLDSSLCSFPDWCSRDWICVFFSSWMCSILPLEWNQDYNQQGMMRFSIAASTWYEFCISGSHWLEATGSWTISTHTLNCRNETSRRLCGLAEIQKTFMRGHQRRKMLGIKLSIQAHINSEEIDWHSKEEMKNSWQ